MDFFSACDRMAELVEENIRDLVGNPRGGETLKIGADLTPTKVIDQVAEDQVIGFQRENPLCSLLISEEAGKVEFDGDEGTLFLDPADGTFNAVAGIHFMRSPSHMAMGVPSRKRSSGTSQAERRSLRNKEDMRVVTTSLSGYRTSPVSMPVP